MSSVRSTSRAGICFAVLSDVGMKRPMNQDAHTEVIDGAAESDPSAPARHLFVVADGMGAHAAGELASQMAVTAVEGSFQEQDERDVPEVLTRAIHRANAEIHQRGQQDTQLYNMGTTCTVLVLSAEGAWVAHVGDSRAYRCREQVICQLTFDHSLVWEMRAAGQLGRSEHDSGVPRNVITRCLGPHAEVEADIEGPFSVRVGDVFLLCSDGLTGRVSDAEIGVATSQLAPESAVQFLVDLANLRGGSDNVTVSLARVEDDRLAAPGRIRDTPRAASGMGTHAGWWFGAAAGLLTILVALAVHRPEIAAVGGGLFLLSALGAGIQWLQQQDQTTASVSSPYVTVEGAWQPTFVLGVHQTFEQVLLQLGTVADETLREQVAEAKDLSGENGRAGCEQLATLARALAQRLKDA